MRGRLDLRPAGLRSATGLLTIIAVGVAAAAFVSGAAAGIASGALHCSLPKYNPTHYALQVGTTVTCTIDGASDASGKTTVPVFIKSSTLGNTTVTGTVSGSGSSTKITFTYTAPRNGCETTIVAYISLGNNTNNSVITPGGHAAAGFAFVDASGNPAPCGAPTPPHIYFGYADSYRAVAGFPSPWEGDANVTFIGCGYAGGVCPTGFNPVRTLYDSGAIRIDNTSGSPMTVSNASVEVPGLACANFTPWPGLNVAVPGGGTLILTQTGTSGDPCGIEVGNYNFDTSDTWEAFPGHKCGANDGLIPRLHVTINGTPQTIDDTGQVLNWKGVDPVECLPSPPSEVQNWVQVQ